MWYFFISLGGIGSGGLVAEKESPHLYLNYIYFYFGLENDIYVPTNWGDIPFLILINKYK